ncbi:MAG: hypothetical protein ACXWCK_32560 [Burkholderiales bacterium]
MAHPTDMAEHLTRQGTYMTRDPLVAILGAAIVAVIIATVAVITTASKALQQTSSSSATVKPPETLADRICNQVPESERQACIAHHRGFVASDTNEEAAAPSRELTPSANSARAERGVGVEGQSSAGATLNPFGR